MDQNIKNQYKVSFEKVNLEWESFGKDVTKTVNTNNECLTSFLNSWNSLSEINDILLNDINVALASPNMEIDSDSDIIDIVMFNNLVDFYDRNGYVNTIPLSDFKEIVIGWRDFLMS